jgi:metal-responsive CopG/Arc/MetJ family transcriptional regulator
MSTATVNIAFQVDFLKDIDAIAKSEARSRSELLREAVRLYIERKRRWDSIFVFGSEVAMQNSLSEKDVTAEIKMHRQKKNR